MFIQFPISIQFLNFLTYIHGCIFRLYAVIAVGIRVSVVVLWEAQGGGEWRGGVRLMNHDVMKPLNLLIKWKQVVLAIIQILLGLLCL